MSAEKQSMDRTLLHILNTVDYSIRNGLHGRLGGLRPSERRGSSVEWKEYSEYMPGDDIRRIDWNLAARFDRYYTKHFLDEQRLTMHVYLDVSGSMALGNKAQMARQLAEAFGYLAVRRSDIAAFRLLRGSECIHLDGNLLTERAFYQTAAKLEKTVFEGDTDIFAAIRSELAPGYRDGISFLISDLLTPSDWKAAIGFLRSKKREVALIHILSQDEISPPAAELCMMNNIEIGGDSLQMSIDRGALQAYRKAFDEWMENIRQFCAHNHVMYFFVESHENIAKALLKKGHQAGLIR